MSKQLLRVEHLFGMCADTFLKLTLQSDVLSRIEGAGRQAAGKQGGSQAGRPTEAGDPSMRRVQCG